MDISNVYSESTPVQISSQNRVKLTHTTKTSIRYGLSERAAAAMATATLLDFKIIDKENTSLVVDKNKIARGKKS